MSALRLASLLSLLVVAACTYEPLQLESSRPSVADGALSREFVVFGTAELRYIIFVNDSAQSVCTIEADLEGYVPDEIPAGCRSCSEVYSLVLAETDSDCEWSSASVVSVGFDDLESFPSADYPNWWQAMEENDAVAFGRTDWHPGGSANWEPRMSVYEDEEGDWEDLGFARGFVASTYYVYATAYEVSAGGNDFRVYGGMTFNLRMTE